ncbi:TRAP transporter small permease [Rhizobium sp. L1K21]|uniref:TRAP transporter small permease n=1 Tax=Rhizobium sp. L1K21 TaxID=2954933 RepID=UPI0020920A3E|nr:TRAP transporter small permease [Rhizobium sp. L1K21]MCO6184737.1 TRAP transporter small permease [Rhizobium sp. L1K21]
MSFLPYGPWLLLALLVLVYYIIDKLKPEALARFEENTLAILLAVITLVAFTQVIARYGFNSGWSGALEFQRILFAWLILFGMSYGVRTSTHLGVDAFVRMLPPSAMKMVAIFGALACIVYAAIFLAADWLQIFGADTKGGSVFYWSKIYKINAGLDEMKWPEFMVNALGLKERLPRWLAYLILPAGLALFILRSAQALVQIAKGERDLIIAGHEAEDLVAEHKDALKD